MNMHDAMPAFEPEEQPGTPSPFDTFLDQARATKERLEETARDLPESWADPDPAAITRLPDSRHPVKHLYAKRTGLQSSRDNFLYAARQCCERLQGLPPRSLTMEDVYAYPWHLVDADMAADYARLIYATYDLASSRNGYISTLRQIAQACHRARLISIARRDEILEELPTVAPGESTRRRRLAQVEIQALLDACQDGPAGVRDAAVIAFFATTGVRVSELVAIDIRDWGQRDRSVLLRHTKNGRPHTVFVHPGTHDYLIAWLQVRGSGPGALFSWSGGPFTGAPVHRATVRQWLRHRQQLAGIAKFGTHDFRRTLVSTLLRHHDISLVSQLVNHKKAASTYIYDMASEDEQRSAINGLGLLPPARPTGPDDDENPDVTGVPACAPQPYGSSPTRRPRSSASARRRCADCAAATPTPSHVGRWKGRCGVWPRPSAPGSARSTHSSGSCS